MSMAARFGLLVSCVAVITACSSNDSVGTTVDADADAVRQDAAGSTDGSDAGSKPDASPDVAGHDAAQDGSRDGNAGCATNADCNTGASTSGMYCDFGDNLTQNLTQNQRATCPSTGTCKPLPDPSLCAQPCASNVTYCGCSGATYGCPHCAEVNGDTVRWEDPSGACN
jgi:hypothetical protein